MTQAYWEADGADVGSAPSNMTYSQPWHAFNSVQVASYSGHVDWDYSLELTDASYPTNSRRILEVSELDGVSLADNATVEIYAVFDIDSQYTQVGAVGRSSGNSTSETGVGVRAKTNANEADTFEYDNATFSYITQTIAGLTISSPIAVRMQLSSTDCKIKVWDYDSTEPASWQDTGTTSITASGGFGVFSFSMYGPIQLLALGIGTAGDSAPTAPVSGGSTESISHAASAGDTFTATVTAAASITEGISAGDASSNLSAILAALSEAANANETQQAIATAAAAIIEGAAAGESWVAQATALAEILESAQGGESIARVTSGLESALISDGTAAAESFVAAVQALAALSDTVNASDSYAPTISAITSISEAAVAGAVFEPSYGSVYLLADAITVVAALSVGAISVNAGVAGTIEVTQALSGTGSVSEDLTGTLETTPALSATINVKPMR